MQIWIHDQGIRPFHLYLNRSNDKGNPRLDYSPLFHFTLEIYNPDEFLRSLRYFQWHFYVQFIQISFNTFMKVNLQRSHSSLDHSSECKFVFLVLSSFSSLLLFSLFSIDPISIQLSSFPFLFDRYHSIKWNIMTDSVSRIAFTQERKGRFNHFHID